MKLLVFTLFFTGMTLHASPAVAKEAEGPPVAPVRPVVDDYHGTKVTDSYRYMENLKDPETLNWMKSQSAHAKTSIDRIPGKGKLLARIKALDQGAPYYVSGITRLKNGMVFYQKLIAGADTGVVCSRPSLDGAETQVFDPKVYEEKDGPHASMEFVVPSPDGRYLLVGISKGGSEVTTIYVRDLTTKRDLPEVIDRIETAYNIPEWLPDASGFFYSRRQKLPADAPAAKTYENTTAMLHRLGRSVDEDRPIFGKDLHKGIPFAPLDFPSISVYPTENTLIGQIHHGDSNEVTLYLVRMDALGEKIIPWVKLCDHSDGVVSYTPFRDWVYLVTSKDAPGYKIVRTTLAKPLFAKAEVVLPESDLVPSAVMASKNALFVNASKDGLDEIFQLDPEHKLPPRKITPPGGGTGYVGEALRYLEEIMIYAESWTKGGTYYHYDIAKKEFKANTLQPKGAFDDLPGFTSKEVLVKSHDGALVPLSIISQEGVALDGSHPLLLSGYGAYGTIQYVGFNALNIAWLERGGVLAIAHVRGGGEKGKQWHVGGQKANKPNTWKDFIACAEYLINQKYTNPTKLAIQGGSAGGILIGRSIIERPKLFQAAIINVGLSDLLRFELTENGPPNIQEFGSVTTVESFRALFEMSPLHQIKEQTPFPAVLLTHGLNDRRVDAWMSAKMTARLQETTSSGKPILLLLDTDAGHGIGSTRSQVQEQLANEWSFLLWQLNEPGFQPEK